MYLFFTDQGKVFSTRKLATLSGSPASLASGANSLLDALLGEERPGNMLILLSVLVFLLHLWGGIWLLRTISEPGILPAKPLLMEVSMITMAAPKPSLAPPPPAAPLPVKKPEPVKPQVKPIPKKLPTIVPKALDAAPAEKFVEPQPAAPTAASAAPAPTAAAGKAEAASDAEPFTEANFRANYASNPKPEYPAIAKSRDWQGKVMLRVQVSAAGLSDAVKVEKSSGYEMLDEAAVEAVKNWRFIPAKRGETPVASSVLVPINFSLRD